MIKYGLFIVLFVFIQNNLEASAAKKGYRLNSENPYLPTAKESTQNAEKIIKEPKLIVTDQLKETIIKAKIQQKVKKPLKVRPVRVLSPVVDARIAIKSEQLQADFEPEKADFFSSINLFNQYEDALLRP